MADTPSDADSDAGAFDPYHKWLGIPPKEQPPNYYRLLGIELFEDDIEVIESAGNRQSAFLRQLALGPHMAASQQLLNEVSKAQVCLLRPEKKAKYDEKLRLKLATSEAVESSATTPQKDEDAAATVDAKPVGQPSLPDRLKQSRQRVTELFRKLPRSYRIGGTAIVVLFVPLIFLWPETVDPGGPARFRVEVDEAFATQFESKFIYYAIDESEIPIDQLANGIELEGGDHTLEVKVADRPGEEEGEAAAPRPDKAPEGSRSVMKREFSVVATEPPTLQLSVADGLVTDTLLLTLNEEEFDLPGGSSGEVMVLEGGEKEYIRKSRPSASGRYLLMASSSGTLRLWNLEARRAIRVFRAGRYVNAFAFAPDGQSILANGDGTELRLIDMSTGKRVLALEGHTVAPMSVEYSPDGKLAASAGGSGDGSVRMWDLETGSERWMYARAGRNARDIRFSPDGASVFAFVDDALVRLAADSGQPLALYDALPPYVPTADSLGLLARGIDSSFQLWHTERGRAVQEYELKSNGPLAISPNGHYAALVMPDGKESSIRIWNTATGEEVAKFNGHKGDIYDVAFFASGRFLSSSGRDGTCRIWRLPALENPASGAPFVTPEPEESEHGDHLQRFRFAQNSAAASRDGMRVASLYYGGAKVWDSTSGRLVSRTSNHGAEHVSLSQDGKTVVTASGQAVHIWDVETGRERNRIAMPGTSVRAMSLSPDNTFALVSLRMNATGPLTPVMVDLVTGGEVGRFPESESPAILTGDGGHVVSIDDTIIRVYDSRTGNLVQSLEGHEPSDRGPAIMSPLAVSANGKVIASIGSADRKLRVWGVDGSTIAALPVEGSISRLAVSPAGSHVYGNNNGLTAIHVASGNARSLVDASTRISWLAAVSSPCESVRHILTMEGGNLSVRSLSAAASDELKADIPQPTELDFEGWRGAVQQFRAHERGVRHLEFSDDGATLLTVSGYDRNVRLWKTESLEEREAIDPGEGPVVAAAFPDGGKSIVSIHSNGAIVETDIVTKRTSRWSQKHDLTFTSFDVSPDGSGMVSTATDGRSGVGNVSLWDMKAGTQMWQYSLHNTGASSAGFSADGQHIVAGVDGVVRLLDVETGKAVRVFDGTGQPGATVTRFAPLQTDRLLTAAAGALRLWNTATGQETLRFRGYSTQVPAKTVAMSPDGRFMASLAAGTPAVRIWNLTTGQQVAQFGTQEAAMDCMAFSPTGKTLAFGHASGQVTVWELPDPVLNNVAFGFPEPALGEPVDHLNASLSAGPSGAIEFASGYAGTPECSRDGQRLAAGHGGCAKVWKTQTGELVFRSPNLGIAQARISADGRRVLSSHRYGYEYWDVASGEKLAQHRIQGFVALDFAPDGRHVAVILQQKKKGSVTVDLRDAETADIVRTLGEGEIAASSVMFSPEGNLVGVISEEAVRVFDVASGDAVAELTGHGKGVYRFAFSDDESQLTSVAFDNTVRVWSIETGTEIARYRPGSQYVYPSGNGTCLVVTGNGLSLVDLEHEPPESEPTDAERPKTGTLIEIPGSNLRGSRLNGVHFVTGGTHVITAAQDAAVRFWKLPPTVAE